MKHHDFLRRIARAGSVPIVCAFLSSFTAASPIPVCTSSGDQFNPAIWGDVVVWQDHRHATTNLGDIYCHNIATGQTSVVCATMNDQQMPAIWGDTVVWMDDRGSAYSYRLYCANLSTGAQGPVALVAAEQWSPSIEGRRVAWEQKAPGGTDEWNIYSCVIGGSLEAICTAAGGQYCARVSGNRIVWKDVRLGSGSWAMWVYDLVSRRESVIGGRVSDGGGDVWGHRVVWEDERTYSATKTDIYGFDLRTGLEFPICTNATFQWNPVVWGDNVVWMDKRAGNWDIYLFNIALNEEYALVTGPGNQMFPRIYEDRVVYEHDPDNVAANGNSDIYRVNIPARYMTTRARCVGLNNRAASDPIVKQASPNFLFAVWGRVTPTGTDSFTLDDGSGNPVTVISPGYSTLLNSGDVARAVGVFDKTTAVTLVCPKAYLTKLTSGP